MKFRLLSFLILLVAMAHIRAHDHFPYDIVLKPVNIPNLPGLHSYAFAQSGNLWLVLGGRRDGLHARQPFNSFPAASNNSEIFVIDVQQKKFWRTGLAGLGTSLQEQLQSTNMAFYQDADTLYFLGGYAFSPTAGNHITFPYLTSIQVSGLVQAVIEGRDISPYFKQINDNIFAVSGGYMGKINDKFILAGGHRFDGRYNPQNNPTFTQTYTHQIRRFHLNNSGSQLSYSDYAAETDFIHLRRRDFNLLPQIFPDRKPGYTISSGVFQSGADLPFLYPVDIKEDGYYPQVSFNQYLCNYHSAKAVMYDSMRNQMHSLFFGGMSQYYYQNGTLIQDNQVPFVKTISRLTRYEDGSLKEYHVPVEMPGLKGSSAEFIPNKNLKVLNNEIIDLNAAMGDSILIGHIYGGILSPTLNPFSNNQTNTTSADPSIYAVYLVRTVSGAHSPINGGNPFSVEVYPQPVSDVILISAKVPYDADLRYFVSSLDGRILRKGKLAFRSDNQYQVSVEGLDKQMLILTIVFDEKYYSVNKVMMK